MSTPRDRLVTALVKAREKLAACAPDEREARSAVVIAIEQAIKQLDERTTYEVRPSMRGAA